MKFLFETTAFSYNFPVFYRINQISQHEFQAESVQTTHKSFNLRKQNGHWIAEGTYTQHHADQIGKQIDQELVMVRK